MSPYGGGGRGLQEPGGSQFRGAEKFCSDRADGGSEHEFMVLRVSKREMFRGLLRWKGDFSRRGGCVLDPSQVHVTVMHSIASDLSPYRLMNL